jgi:peptide chain release factor 1
MQITESIKIKLDLMVKQHQALSDRLSQADTVADIARYQALSKEFSQLNTVVVAYQAYQAYLDKIQEAEALLAETDAPDMQAFIEEELAADQADLSKQEEAVCVLLLPKDPDDDCNAFVEIRAGTGGQEAGLFAADLFRMYTRFAELKRWRVEIVSRHENEQGGFKEIILHVKGTGVYAIMKYESGTHRVQRVPETESQGRIHTSACTVAVMPEIEHVESVEIDPSELRIDTYRASGAGGQHVNKTDSAVRITHLPTGTVVECQEERSQHKNKAKALKLVQTKILAEQRAAQKKAEAAQRKNLVGSGDRSERIRTYNFPQGRVTDHRINLTLYALDEILTGQLDALTIPLSQEDQLQQMAALNESDQAS